MEVPQSVVDLPSENECRLDNRGACGEPVTGEGSAWVWYPVEGTQCQDGSSTGFAVRIGTEPGKVMFYLEGGGACYNNWSCENIFASSYTGDDFSQREDRSVFDTEDAINPFRAWTHVYIPYCSGDLHTGSVPYGSGFEGRSHWGYQNISHFLKRLVPSFESAERIVLVGSSAGGLGATYNWSRVQKAFGSIPVDVIDDSGPFLTAEYLDPCFQERMTDVWAQDVMFKEHCPACLDSGEGFSAQLKQVRQELPNRRYALLSTSEDFVMRSHYGFAANGCERWDEATFASFDETFFADALEAYHDVGSGFENTFMYEVQGSGHVLLFDDFTEGLKTESNGVKLSDWLKLFIAGEPLSDVRASRVVGSN